MQKYNGLIKYLDFITKEYNLKICINDFAGFLYINNEFSLKLQPYMIHNNPFCMAIKSDKQLFKRCLRMKRNILLKCEKTKSTYYGMCYCGIEEYIVPIVCNEVIIGVICVGEFSTHKDISMKKLRMTAKNYNLDLEYMENLFSQSTSTENYNTEMINSMLLIISEYFSDIYSTLISTHSTKSLNEMKITTNETYILSHALEFINNNYKDNITLTDITKFCNCSESYISHIFKKTMKINIKAYINKVRIEHSKELLLDSNLNISQIALKIGFNEPNYFSNVFREICGLSPSAFRQRFASDTK